MKLSALAQFVIFFPLILVFVFLSGCSTEAQRHYELGKWYYEKGLINEAILEFKAATQKDPDFYQAHQSLAIAYAKKGWYDYALKEAEISFDLHPSDESYNLIQIIRHKKILEPAYESALTDTLQ
ncbi:MAG: tetratricopeptide repeat protein [Candidatus Marinimicrobia bacterium]|nr:tetratricopeptide repeat protein [Candidatus Neomarinimicrobiota bacterium]